MIIEKIIKLFISIPLLITALFSVLLTVRLWKTQIDIPKTINLWISDQLSFSNWIAVRDNDGIYQNGKLVGKVEKPPIFNEDKIIFPKVRYMAFMNEEQSVEFQRFKCSIIINITMQVQGMETASWYQNLQCKILKNK